MTTIILPGWHRLENGDVPLGKRYGSVRREAWMGHDHHEMDETDEMDEMNEMNEMNEPGSPARDDRRRLLAQVSTVAMTGGLVAAYGTLGAMGARFLYPTTPATGNWYFVCEVERLAAGQSLLYRTPAGATIAVARQGKGSGVADFIALSSTCPHLGCQVRWEAQNDRFFCPCHNGVFDPSGKAIAGPPAAAGQSLERYPLRIEKGLLYLDVPHSQLAESAHGEVIDAPDGPCGPGHDPCLSSLAAGMRKA